MRSDSPARDSKSGHTAFDVPSLSPNYAILEYQIDNKWVLIARQGGVRNARDDAGTSTSIPDRDMLTGSYITSLTRAQSPKFGNEGGLATSQNSCFLGKTG